MIVVRALKCGLTLRDFETLTLGMITGIYVTYVNENSTEEDAAGDAVRAARQSDFDSF